MENKYLQVRKNNIFQRIVSFLKNLFKFKKDTNNTMNIEKSNDITGITKIKNEFRNEIEIEEQYDKDILELQFKYQQKEIELKDLSDEQVHKLNLLYIEQKRDKLRKIDNLKTEINMIKHQLKNLATNN